SFRIVAESAEGVDMGRLTLRGALPVAVCLLVPQAVFIVATSSVLSLFAYRLDAQTYQSLGSLSFWLRLLVVGRFSVGFAIPANSPGFRLRAYPSRIATS